MSAAGIVGTGASARGGGGTAAAITGGVDGGFPSFALNAAILACAAAIFAALSSSGAGAVGTTGAEETGMGEEG